MTEGGYYFWLGASADAETGSREPSPAVSALTRFDPARCRECGASEFEAISIVNGVCYDCFWRPGR